jgi:tripartite-type tricarboxylate transporter receptor subunit TctC
MDTPGGNVLTKVITLLALLVAVVSPVSAFAADAASAYPNRPVRLVTGSPGSTSDIVARFVAQKLTERWGRTVVVDNRPGAGGIIGTEIVAKSAPDGYTLIIGQIGTHASPQFLFKSLAYDPVKDFAPISLLTNSGISLVIHPSVPANNLKDFVAYARSKPGALNYGSAGGGTSSQLSGELFNQMTGAKLVHVPYKGAGFALTAVVQGETQAAFLSTTTAAAQVKAGKLKALAVMSPKRFPAAPDIPSITEAGYPGMESSVWFGLLAPAATPKPIVDKINRDVVAVLGTPEAREQLLVQGAEPTPTTPQEFAAFLKREIEKWGRVIKEAGIKAS